MRKTIRIAIEEDAHRQAKARAALEGITLAALIERAINEYIAKPEPKPSKSTGKGTRKGAA